MAKGLVLMTALVPTIGHQHLLEFAARYPGLNKIHVILSSRKCEPIPGSLRFEAIQKQMNHLPIKFVFHHMTEEMPQEPKDHPNFWKIWVDAIKWHVGEMFYQDDVAFASEMYGIELAHQLGCQFVPCDIERAVFRAQGTTVRSNLPFYFNDIMPSFKWYFKKRIVLFGQESCGKTTMAKALAEHYETTYVPEWAREYLEKVAGPHVTMEKMKTIEKGQYAAMKSAHDMNPGHLTIFDTDLLSTIGYYGIWNKEPNWSEPIWDRFWLTKGDLYIVMPDHIPFEKDILRYGVDKRESTMGYWINLLEKNGCSYVVAPAADHSTQYEMLIDYIDNWYREQFKDVKEYKR